MNKDKLELVICRTCLRDNPGEESFADFESNASAYQSAFKESWLKKTAEVKYQNCFAQCENFYCVQVIQNQQGFLLKKISSREKMNHVIAWLQRVKKGVQAFELPSELRDHLIAPVKNPQEKYKKI